MFFLIVDFLLRNFWFEFSANRTAQKITVL